MSYITNPANGIKSTNNSTTSNVGGSTLVDSVSGITILATTITVDSTTQFPTSGAIKIDSEYIIYSGTTATTFTGCTRGAYNSTAATHNDNATVIGIYVGTSELNAQPDVMVSLKSDQTGTEYFDFSNDDTNWDTFPVSGFAVSANIHEFHTAVKGKRYFRIRFESSSSSITTNFRVNTYYGVFRQGNLPLNQSITDDADSIVVRSVQVGKDPTGSYVNSRSDGYIFTTTATLGIDTSYNSSIFNTSGFTQIQTELYANVPGNLYGYWYADSSGSILMRTFNFVYNNAGSLETFSAPIFAKYLKYRYLNGSTGQTSFNLGLKFLTKAISGQILGVESFVSSSMIANLSRSITMGKQPDGDYVNTPADGSAFSSSTNLGGHTAINDATGITSGDTVIQVDSTTNFTGSGTVLIDNELIYYANTSGNFLTGCIRGNQGTTATTHADNSIVYDTYISNWTDTDGWNDISIFIRTDQYSKPSGLRILFTDNAQADTPATRATQNYTVAVADITRGYRELNFNPLLDGFRVIYVNGAVTTTNFYLDAALRVNSTPFNFNKAQALTTADFMLESALGNMSNYYVNYKFGRNPDVDISTAPEDVWSAGATYTGHPSSTGETIVVVSSSASDTSAGTGARTVTISGLKTNTSTEYEEETVTMSGTTPVATTVAWWRVNRAYVATAGSGEQNAGVITVRHQTTSANIFVTIPIGINQSLVAAYTVPYQSTMLIKKVYISISRASGAAGSAYISLRARESGGVYRTLESYDISTGSIIDQKRLGGYKIPALTDIKFRVESVSDNDTLVNAGFEYILINIPVR